MEKGSKDNLGDAVLSMLRWARKAGTPWSHFSTVISADDKPKDESVTQRKKRNPFGDEDDNGTPFTVAEVRKILDASKSFDVPLYIRLGCLLGAHHALNASDAYNLLTGDGRFVDRSPEGLGLWYLNGRQKTNTRIFVPLTQTVVDALTPYLSTDGGQIRIDLRSKICVVKTWREEFRKVRTAAGVTGLRQEDWKRFRNTYRHQMKDRMGVPEAVVKCGMAHKIKDGSDIGKTYDHADPEQMVAAAKKWDAVLSAPPAALASTA